MGSLTVRRLLVDLETPFERHWNGGDAFRTAFFNALSMSFPVGEQFFIDSLRKGVKSMSPEQRAVFDEAVQGFVGQEATHRRVHALFNEQLARQGCVNTWEVRARSRIRRFDAIPDPRHAVAATAATEHFTAILAEHLLVHPQVLEGAEPRLKTMWLWHASEEAEHRSVAFDVYRALGGSELWRRRWMRIVALHFTTDVLRQTARNLWEGGELLRWRTLTSAVRFFFGEHGLVRHTFRPWRDYFKASFHPMQQGGALAERWLAENDGTAFRAVAAQ
ncbi:MAG TPA: metal-dependent hydrolase [Burkholderiaceae bacterium]|nr:metal-dependent hydrolase [Burkholderiaceae bacterium]